MDSNQLFKYVYAKYGLKFKPIVANNTDTYILTSPVTNKYFAMLSRIKNRNNNSMAVLNLKCGDFASTIRDLPGFMEPVRIKSAGWVGAALTNNHYDEAIKKALDFAFKLAMNDQKVNVAQDQYFYIPPEKEEQKYQAQPIKPRDKKIIHKEKSLVPDKIRQMIKLYDYSILPIRGRAKNFFIQGRFMADYEDHYDKFFAFKRFFPSYHDMSVGQLRSYFTWRTKWLRGDYHRTSTSYAYVYVYELLNNIGVNSPEEGYQRLVEFEQNYIEKFDSGMQPYLADWLKDYVLYYDLGKEKIKTYFQNELEQDRDNEILHSPQKYSATELAEVFAKKTSYWKASKVIQTHSELFAAVLKCAWLELLNAKKYQLAYYSTFVARPKVIEQSVFKSAVFYPKSKTPITIQIDAIRKYHYQKGRWFIHLEEPVKRQKTNLNTFLHELDRLVREKFKLGRAIKPRVIDQAVLKAIEQGIRAYQEQAEQAKIDQVKIDFANLKQIRANASVTRDSLLTDEEKELEQQEEQKAVEKQNSAEVLTQNDYDLSPDEMFLLISLLKKQSWQTYVKQHHLMTSILADSINEKLFDKIGDSVIEFDENDQPQIITDYVEDLKEIFLKG